MAELIWNPDKPLELLQIDETLSETESRLVPIRKFLRMPILMAPVQRPLKKAKHLKRTQPTHGTFHVGKLGTQLYHLDGHQRIAHWVAGLAKAPAKVTMITIHCNTLQDVADYYYHFDSRAAVETEADRYFGVLRAFHSLGKFNSDYLKNPPIQALKEASGLRSIIEATKAYHDALLHLDKLYLTKNRLPSGVVAGLLVLIKHEKWLTIQPFAHGLVQGFTPEGQPLDRGGSNGLSRLLQELIHMKKHHMWTGGAQVKMMKELVLGAWVIRTEPRVLSIPRTTTAAYLATLIPVEDAVEPKDLSGAQASAVVHKKSPGRPAAVRKGLAA